MGQTVNVNIRMDEELKKQSEQLFSDLGLNMTTAFNMFVRQAVRVGGIPFEVTTRTGEFYNPYNQKRLQESITRLELGQGTVHELIEDDEC